MNISAPPTFPPPPPPPPPPSAPSSDPLPPPSAVAAAAALCLPLLIGRYDIRGFSVKFLRRCHCFSAISEAISRSVERSLKLLNRPSLVEIETRGSPERTEKTSVLLEKRLPSAHRHKNKSFSFYFLGHIIITKCLLDYLVRNNRNDKNTIFVVCIPS